MNCSICGAQFSEKASKWSEDLGVNPGQSFVELRTSMGKILIKEHICTKCVGLLVHALYDRKEATEKFLDFLRVAIGLKKEKEAEKKKEEPIGLEALYETDVDDEPAEEEEGVAVTQTVVEGDPSTPFVSPRPRPRRPSIEEELNNLREGDVFTEDMMNRMIRGE